METKISPEFPKIEKLFRFFLQSDRENISGKGEREKRDDDDDGNGRSFLNESRTDLGDETLLMKMIMMT